MEGFVDAISATIREQPLYGIVGIAILLVVTVCLVKKLLKLAAVMAVVLGGYLVYLHHTGQHLPRSVSDVKAELQSTADGLREGASKVGETVTRGVRGKVHEVLDSDAREDLQRKLKRAAREEVERQVEARLAD